MNRKLPPPPDPEKGDWNEYRIHVINSLHSIQSGIDDVKELVQAERAAVALKFHDVEYEMKRRFESLEERLRKLEEKGSVWAVIAGVGTALTALAIAAAAWFFQKSP